jgi:hypothetical protein
MITESRTNPEITKQIESALLDIISENPTKVYDSEQLEHEIRPKMGNQFSGVNILTHIGWALDMLHTNRFVKKVGPALWQSVDGPDPVYAERQTGYSPEGEFTRRGKNFLGTMSSTERKKFNLDVGGAESSVKLLKNSGMDEKEIYDTLANNTGTKYNPVAIKVAIRKVFRLPGVGGSPTDEPEVDPSIFSVDFEK